MTTPTTSDRFVEFRAAFEGAAVDAGRMSARHFAGSVFALTELVEQAAAVEFNIDNAVAIEIRADFRRGSFEFGLLAGVAVPVAQQILTTLSVADLQNLLKHVGFVGGIAGKTLLALVKRFGQRAPIEIRQEGDGNVALIFNVGDHTEIVNGVPSQVSALLQSDRVRAALPDVMKPLFTEGIDRLRIGQAANPEFTVSKEEATQFDPPPARERELTDSVAETALELLSPHFVEGRVWNVAQGNQTFNVRILDSTFIHRIDEGEPFSKGDFLVVELRTRAFATARGLRVEREVLRVLKHHRRAEQGNLF